MRRGFMFSIIVAILLSLLVLFVQIQIVIPDERNIEKSVELSRDISLFKSALDIDEDFPMDATYGTYVLVEEGKNSTELSALASKIAVWDSFLIYVANRTNVSVSLDDYNVSTYLGDNLLTLANNDSEWHWDNDQFSLDHSGAYVLVNNTIANVLNSNCTFNSSGNVSVRIKLNNFDTGLKWINYGETYNCFLNFSEAEHVDIDFDANGDMSMDCSSCPSNYTHRVEWNTTDDKLYPVFGEDTISTASTVNPGWTEPDYPPETGATKHYGSGTYNLIVVDIDDDGGYDTVFVDIETDGNFTGENDLWHLKTQSVADYGGKAFYTTIDLSGNWVRIQKVLAVQTSGVKAVKL